MLIQFIPTRDLVTDIIPKNSVTMDDSSSLCESLLTSWPNLTTLNVTDVSIGDVESTKILETCTERLNSGLSFDKLRCVIVLYQLNATYTCAYIHTNFVLVTYFGQ